MALDFGNLLGAVANASAAMSEEKSLKNFLRHIDDFGVQVKNNFEVNFSGLQDVTFNVTDITLPGVKVNTTDVHYDGRSVPVTINYDYDHDFSITFLNDAQGYIYTAFQELVKSEASGMSLSKQGYTLIVKALNGDKKYKGCVITCRGVHFTNVSGLDFGQSSNDVSTFTVSGQLLDYVVTPGALGTVANVMGVANSVLA